jgi:hypothetical protein
MRNLRDVSLPRNLEMGCQPSFQLSSATGIFCTLKTLVSEAETVGYYLDDTCDSCIKYNFSAVTSLSPAQFSLPHRIKVRPPTPGEGSTEVDEPEFLRTRFGLRFGFEFG